MYHSKGKPSIAKFRSRIDRIIECCATGYDLNQDWNPKGRNVTLQREMDQFFDETLCKAAKISSDLNRR